MDSAYNNRENVILDLTSRFALSIIELCEAWKQNKKCAIARQLIRSGCSIGANVREAQNTESKPGLYT